MNDAWKGRLLTALQWTVAIAAFAYVASGVDWARTVDRLRAVPATVLVAIAALTAVEFASRFGMWYALLHGRTGLTFGTAARIDLVVKFINHLIPSKASGHSIAPLVVRHYTDADWAEAVTAAGLNTGLYATLYGVISLAGLAVFATRLPAGLLVVIVGSVGMYLVAGVLVLLAGRRMEVAGRLFGGLERVVGAVPKVGDRLAGVVGSVPTFTEESAAVFRSLSSDPRVVVPYALGLAGTIVVVPGARVLLLLWAFGGSFEPAVALPLALVLAYSVTVLPLTPGGVGVAEASATAVLISLGVAGNLAAVVVVVDRTVGVYLPALLGWLPMGQIDLRELLDRGEGA